MKRKVDLLGNGTNEFLVNNEHVKNSVAVRVPVIGIRASGQHQPIALFLAQTRGKAQRVFTPINVSAKNEEILRSIEVG